jgi:hypothetical protein
LPTIDPIPDAIVPIKGKPVKFLPMKSTPVLTGEKNLL